MLFTLYTMGNKESGSADKEFVATYTSVDSTNDCNYFNNYFFTIIITMLVSRILTGMSFCTSAEFRIVRGQCENITHEVSGKVCFNSD